MKKTFVLFLLLATVGVINAQWVVNPFENVAADTVWQYPLKNTGFSTGTSSLTLEDATTPAPFAGEKSLKVTWTVHSSESWGGFAQMYYAVPRDTATFKFMSWGSAKYLKLRYNNLTPSSAPGLVNMRFKIHESGGEANYMANGGDHEDWYYEIHSPYDSLPGWKEIMIPLTDLGAGDPSDKGFSLPGWSGIKNNGVLDFDKIIGYSIEWTTPAIPNNGTATGVVMFDDLAFYETAYNPISTFDNVGADTSYFVKDLMSWSAGNTGALTLTDFTPAFEGASTLKIDYTAHATENWGGYVNFTHNAPAVDTFIQNMQANKELVIYLKVLQAPTGTTGRTVLRLHLFDVSDGGAEQWYHVVNVNLYQTSEWQKVHIPLVDRNSAGTDQLDSSGFRLPSWEGYKGNNNLDLNKISAWKFEFSIGGDDKGPRGEVATGSILMDLMTPAGFQETDKQAPAEVTGLQVIPGTYTNLVTWNDVAGEQEEKYTIYYSSGKIDENTNLDTCEVAKWVVTENNQLVEHLLRAPATDQDVTYYYAIQCTDKVGNRNKGAFTATAATNKAKGVPTIAMNGPANFAADGNLSEWSTFTPFDMKTSDGSAFIAVNTKIDGDADLSLKGYVAMDQEFLYVAFDIEDDVVSFKPELDSYLNDAPDLFLGFFNSHGKPHFTINRGANPDYHFRFGKDRVRLDGVGDSLEVPGANYFWGEKFPTGYVVEAKIPLAKIAEKAGDPVFVPVEGYRIPIDFSINDADATGSREGILTYSPFNDDKSYADPSRWLYTWYGDKWYPTVGVDNQENPFTYSLLQNYPNPFNPATSIKFTLKETEQVTLRVFDMLGREVATVINEVKIAGEHTVQFNGAGLSSGVYFYKLEAGSFMDIKKMVILK